MATTFIPSKKHTSLKETTFLNRNRMSNFTKKLVKAFNLSVFIMLMLLTYFGANTGTAQDLVNSNLCGQDAIIQTFIRGVEGSAANWF